MNCWYGLIWQYVASGVGAGFDTRRVGADSDEGAPRHGRVIVRFEALEWRYVWLL
jgi:hypothetical protein